MLICCHLHAVGCSGDVCVSTENNQLFVAESGAKRGVQHGTELGHHQASRSTPQHSHNLDLLRST